MIAIPSGVHVWLATGHTDMRKGFDSLGARPDRHRGRAFVAR
jgi:transposase